MPLPPIPPTSPILHMELTGGAAPGDARRAAHDFLGRPVNGAPAFPPVALDTALLVISELVTNAVRHTSGGCVLDLHLTAGGVDVAVTDTSSAEPRPRQPGHQGEGGWGWHLVNRLGSRVEIRHRGERDGKTIHVYVPR